MEWDRYGPFRVRYIDHHVVTSGYAIDPETRTPQSSNHLPRISDRETRVHAAIVIFRIVGVASPGIGKP